MMIAALIATGLAIHVATNPRKERPTNPQGDRGRLAGVGSQHGALSTETGERSNA